MHRRINRSTSPQEQHERESTSTMPFTPIRSSIVEVHSHSEPRDTIAQRLPELLSVSSSCLTTAPLRFSNTNPHYHYNTFHSTTNTNTTSTTTASNNNNNNNNNIYGISPFICTQVMPKSYCQQRSELQNTNTNTKINTNTSSKWKGVSSNRRRNRELLPPLIPQESFHTTHDTQNIYCNDNEDCEHKTENSTKQDIHSVLSHSLKQSSDRNQLASSSSSFASELSYYLRNEQQSPENNINISNNNNKGNVQVLQKSHEQIVMPSSSLLRTLNRPSKPISLNNTSKVNARQSVSTTSKCMKNINKINNNNVCNSKSQTNMNKMSSAYNKSKVSNARADTIVKTNDARLFSVSPSDNAKTNADQIGCNSNDDMSSENINFFKLSADELKLFTLATWNDRNGDTTTIESGAKRNRENVPMTSDSNSSYNNDECTKDNLISLEVYPFTEVQKKYAKEHHLRTLFSTMVENLLLAEPIDPQQ